MGVFICDVRNAGVGDIVVPEGKTVGEKDEINADDDKRGARDICEFVARMESDPPWFRC